MSPLHDLPHIMKPLTCSGIVARALGVLTSRNSVRSTKVKELRQYFCQSLPIPFPSRQVTFRSVPLHGNKAGLSTRQARHLMSPDSPEEGGEIFCSPLSVEEEQLVESVKRSRKRYLSPSTLRGDQAVDRLKIQELSASPFLKKPRPDETPDKADKDDKADQADSTDKAGDMALSAEEFRAVMAENKADVSSRFDGLDSSIRLMDNSVKANTAKLESHEALIKSNQREVASLRGELLSIKNAKPNNWPSLPAPANLLMPAPEVPEDLYWTARRSLRIWPIVGVTGEELWGETGKFLHVLLALPSIGESLIEKIARPNFPSGFGVKHEVLITFKSSDTRDTVIGASSKLSSKIDAAGRPTAGIRIEIPQAMRGLFNLLNRFGQQLRARHGEGTRRHVKFDDADRTLYLNVKLPGESNWSRVDEEFARRGLQLRRRITSQEMEDRFDMAGMGSGPSRSSSTSSGQPNVVPPTSWTGRRAGSTS